MASIITPPSPPSPQPQEKLVDPPFTETAPANMQPPGSSMGLRFRFPSFPLSPFVKSAITSSVLLLLFVPTACLIVARDAQLLEGPVLADIAGLQLVGYGYDLDIQARVVSISWELTWCNASERSQAPGGIVTSLVACGPPYTTVDLYLDNLSTPALSHVPQAFPSDAFFTGHYIGSGAKSGYSEQLITPFDRYSLRTFAAAVDPTTNLSVYIARLAVTSPLSSFEIRSRDTNTTGPAPFFALRLLNVTIKRSTISRMFMMSLVTFNWSLTIGMIYTTGLVMFGMIEPGSTVALMPFSMILAIPAIRSLYTDLPCLATSFETAGFFVQMLFIGLCELALLRKLTLRRFIPPLDHFIDVV